MGNDFFQKKVRQLREGRDLTMEQLAKEMGVTKSRVNMWENGGTVPRQDVLLRLSQFFGVSTDDLLGNIRTEGDNATMHSLQRNLKKLNGEQLEKANAAMKLLFTELWDDEEDHGTL